MTQTFLLLCVNISGRSHLLFVTWHTMWCQNCGFSSKSLKWQRCSEKNCPQREFHFKLFLLFRNKNFFVQQREEKISKSTHAETRRKVNLTKILILSKKLVRKCVVLLHRTLQTGNVLYGWQVVRNSTIEFLTRSR